MKKLYIIPNFNCNLNCPHCVIHNMKDSYDENEFFSSLNSADSKEYVMFGGEPLFFKDRFDKLVDTNKITSIATNLLLMNDYYAERIKEKEIWVSTSWNPLRFTNEQYNVWLDRLKLLEKYDIKCSVLITLTEDLVSMDINNFAQILKSWNEYKSIDGVLFEPLLDYNMKKDLHKRVDEWLCHIYDLWEFNFKNLIIDRIKDWNCDCEDIYTLYPSGIIKKGCPQNEKEFVLEECLNCEMAGKCRPCRLQHLCSFPKKLYRKVYG